MNDIARKLGWNDHILLWFDLETTGLDEQREEILEVGWGVTGLDLDWILEPTSYLIDADIVLKPQGAMVNRNILRDGHDVDPFVYRMHTESGLWADMISHKRISLDEAERTILSVVNINDKSLVTMAGAGVAQFDMRWIKHHMPFLHARLTYYTIDTGIHERVESLVRRREMRGSSKTARHRSVDDIHDSHRRLIDYRTNVLTGIPR
jgi:oligoribonuclease (3'-5' exoribonuclease)